MKKEVWKSIIEFGGLYEISSHQRVRATPKQYNGYKYKILKPFLDKKYLKVRLSKEDKLYPRTIHRIFAIAFLTNPKKYKYIKHVNGIKTDNSLRNLKWCTKSDYISHAYTIGLMNKKGENNNGKRKLSDTSVIEIYNSIENRKLLAQKYKVSVCTIDDIKERRSWSHINKI